MIKLRFNVKKCTFKIMLMRISNGYIQREYLVKK